MAYHIANGKTPNILPDLLAERVISTWFQPSKRASGTKKWLAHAQLARATVQVNAGARAALLATGQATSLLPVGVVGIEGEFEKGDLVRLTDETGHALGLGLAEYSSDKARERLGQQGKPWRLGLRRKR